MLLFGGRAASGRLDDTWLLEGAGADHPHGVWRQPTLAGASPSARSFHSCTALATPALATPALNSSTMSASCVAIFGGLDANGQHLNDLHLLHVAQGGASSSSSGAEQLWAWVKVRQAGALPSPRASPLLAAVSGGTGGAGGGDSDLIVFGGSSGWSEHGDTVFHGDTRTVPLARLLSAVGKAAAGGAVNALKVEEQEAAHACSEAAAVACRENKEAAKEAAEAAEARRLAAELNEAPPPPPSSDDDEEEEEAAWHTAKKAKVVAGVAAGVMGTEGEGGAPVASTACLK